jgi:hypothetical protein
MANNSNFIFTRLKPLLPYPEKAAQQRSIMIPWRREKHGMFTGVQAVLKKCEGFFPAAV